jgi:hypothetical protein
VSPPGEEPEESPREPSARSDEYRRTIDSLGAVLWEADAASFQFTYVSQGPPTFSVTLLPSGSPPDSGAPTL